MAQHRSLKRVRMRLFFNTLFKWVFFIATLCSLFFLVVLLVQIFSQGWKHLDLEFLTNYASRRPEEAGIKGAIVGTLWVMGVTAPVSLILGVGCALYLEFYAKQSRLKNFIQMNISNLAGVPSVVFGLLGLTIFVQIFGLGRSILAGGLTMSLLILPIIVVSTQEAIRAIPNEWIEASYGMGATKWQTIQRVVLPAALPGITTGSILALSRAVGETAPLIVVGAATFVSFLPKHILDEFTVMPIQIYNWISRPNPEFHNVAAAGIIVLLIVLLLMNSIAIFIRNKFSKRV